MSASATDGASKLSIYDEPSEPIVLVAQPPSALQTQVSSIRRTTQSLYADARTRLRETSSKWVGTEKNLEDGVKSIIAKDEQLNPAALYIGVSTLLGSIITRNRSFPLRFIAPPLFFVLSSDYFLPKTTSNASQYLRNIEKAHAPAVYDAHSLILEKSRQLRNTVQGTIQGSRATAEKWTREGRQTFEETSGIKLQSSKDSKN